MAISCYVVPASVAQQVVPPESALLNFCEHVNNGHLVLKLSAVTCNCSVLVCV